MASNLKVIIGSTRPSRAADRVIPWVLERARDHGGFEVDPLDLRDWPLPLFGEHMGSIGDIADPTYSDPIVKRWNDRVSEGEAFLFITAEYNHSVPGVLKNAIDSVFLSFGFRNKPAAFVGYSGGIAAGTRAVEHLALIAIETEMVPLRNTVLLPQVGTAFDDDGHPRNEQSEQAMTILLDDLAWWTAALKTARAGGELAPASFRRSPA